MFSLMALFLREMFYFFTVTFLSLLLPLSFSLLARLSNAKYLLSFAPGPSPSNFLIISVFLDTRPPLLHSLVSIVTLTVLVQSLKGYINLDNGNKKSIFQPQLSTAWILLCTFQITVALGTIGIICSGVWPVDYEVNDGLLTVLSRTIFFIGLHETMLHWSKAVVRPVVDDTLFGAPREVRWIETVGMGAGFAALWWWSLRDEIGSLVFAVEVGREAFIGLGLIDILGWWLYYLIVTIGMVNLVNGFIWFGNDSLCRLAERNVSSSPMNDNKVKTKA